MKFKCLFTCLLLAVFVSPLFSASGIADKHPLDKSESRTLILENGLKVLMVSDPELNISSASMAVDVGSFMDPDDTPGLAHFLEHMLFLGTEKYPDEGEYKEFLSQNGGYSNAYTARDHTNYVFEIFPDAFEGVLDRFAQFFIAPLFTAEFTEREINAVDSEFELYLESDNWRGQRLLEVHAKEDHPAHKFIVGNSDTLANVKREQVIDFYNKYYSANQMALSLVSTHSLAQMETWVREKFSSIENDGREALRYSPDFLGKKEALRVVRSKAIEDRRSMLIYFNTPATRQDWDAKSSDMIGAIIGYEGTGSLASMLKDENLATSLAAGLWDPTGDYSVTSLSIGLTPEGQANPERLLELLMDYMEMLRQSPYPDYLFQEMATMAHLRQLYTNKGEGANRAEALANRALHIPLEFAENAPTLFLRQDSEFYFEILDQLRPENMLVMISAKDIETDQVEDIFGIEYSYTEVAGELYDRLANPVINPEQTLPNPNPFIPDGVKLLTEQPVLLLDEPGVKLYYGQDKEFQRPKTAMNFKIRIPGCSHTAEDSVLLAFYEASLNEYINEIGYDALMAELGYSVSARLEGVTVSLFGYTESAKKLLPVLVEALKGFEIDQALFESIKERMVREWSSARYGMAGRYVRTFTSAASYDSYFMPHEKASAAEGISLADVYALRDRLLNSGQIEALVYGSVSAPEAVNMVREIQNTLELKPVEEVYQNKVIALNPGSSLIFKDVLPTNNSVFRKDYIAGMATPEMRVAASVLSNLVSAPYYSEMRTRQQLGYVVWSFDFNLEDTVRLGFIIQSGDYDPVELVERSEALVSSFPEMLRTMPEEAFLKATSAVRSAIEKKDKSIAEKATRFFKLAYDHGANWSRRDESLAALDSLTMDDVISFFENAIDPDTAQSQLILLFARQEEELAKETEAETDLNEWKANQTYREVTEL